MTELNEYLGPIEVAGKSLGKQYQAYRIDGGPQHPDMRKNAGLGQCNSCDYFIFNENALILIEETQLIWQIKDLKCKYDYMDEKDQKKFIDEYISNENKLKVYGSMLVLCRLSALCRNAKDLLENKKYILWLVASGMKKEEDTIMFDYYRDRLLRDLRSVLTNNIMDEVIIIPTQEFISKLSQELS